jgi:V/A-type H+-transporting ATPase subunit I
MFYPQEMSEVEIIVPNKDLLPVTKVLSGQGIFNQTDVNYLGNDKESNQPDLWQGKAAIYSGLERRIQSILSSLELPDTNPQNRDYVDLADIDKTTALVNAIESEVKGSVEAINTENKQIERFNYLLQQVEPLSDIDLDFSELQNTKYVYSVFGMMPPENIERLKTSLKRIPFVFTVLSQKRQKAAVMIATSRENTDTLNRATRSAYLDPITLPEDHKGTPREISEQLRNSITASQTKISELKNKLVSLREKNADQLITTLWNVRCSRMTTSAFLHYGRLKYTYIIVGWVYTSSLPFLKTKIKSASPDSVFESRATARERDTLDVPVALNNPKLIRPFQMLVKMYDQPKYSELDPTPLVAILFPLMFGAMFGDVGHGLILAILGGLATSKKVKFLKFLGGLSPIILACGIMSMIFGFLYGSVFGYEDILKPLWLQPGTNIMTILIITIAGGIVVLSLGFLISIYNAVKIKDWSTAFFNHNGLIGLMLYWSLVGLLVTMFMPSLNIPSIIFVITTIISALGMMFSEVFVHLIEGQHPLFEGSFAMYFVQAFFELFETLISFLSNSLSFVRVGAFAVAHGNLSAVFFILGEMVSPNKGVGYWVMFLLGLLFIVGFEGLIVGIQTMRLTYYEIFGKFFNGGGKQFEPLSLHPADNE